MGLFDRFLRRYKDGRLDHVENENVDLRESLTALQLELENLGYERMSAQFNDHIIPRSRLNDIVKICGALAIKNPITVRSINVRADYVFGRGVKFQAKHPLVQSVIDEHVGFYDNQKVLYAHDSMARQEREHQVKGNVFIACFTNPRTGRVIIRTIDMMEVPNIVRNPMDKQQEWFIHREWSSLDGKRSMHTYYPAWGITPDSGASVPDNLPPGDIEWDVPVYHLNFNRHGDAEFAIPEIYPQNDWVVAYKSFLEQWASIIKAFARMAMKYSGFKGKKQAGAARSQFQSSVSLTNPLETNASPTQASTLFLKDGMNAEPVKTAGATTSASEGLPLLAMAATSTGLQASFFGDKSGSGATNEALDRPTELSMKARQTLWGQVFKAILDYAIYMAAVAPYGILREAGASIMESVCPFTNARYIKVTMPANTDADYGDVGVPIDPSVVVKWPDLLERNVTDRVRALVNALTLFGKPLTDIVPDKRLACRLVLEALNIEDIEALMPGFVKMWESNLSVGDDGKPVSAIIIPPAPVAKPGGAAEDPSQGGDVGANG